MTAYKMEEEVIILLRRILFLDSGSVRTTSSIFCIPKCYSFFYQFDLLNAIYPK